MEAMTRPVPLPTHTAQSVAINTWLAITHNSLVPDENPSSCSKLGQNSQCSTPFFCVKSLTSGLPSHLSNPRDI